MGADTDGLGHGGKNKVATVEVESEISRITDDLENSGVVKSVALQLDEKSLGETRFQEKLKLQGGEAQIRYQAEQSTAALGLDPRKKNEEIKSKTGVLPTAIQPQSRSSLSL